MELLTQADWHRFIAHMSEAVPEFGHPSSTRYKELLRFVGFFYESHNISYSLFVKLMGIGGGVKSVKGRELSKPAGGFFPDSRKLL